MAENEHRKRRAAKSGGVIFLVGSIVTVECLGHDKNIHIELRQYEGTPGLVGHAWDVASASTATFTTASPFLFPEQFT